MHRLSRREVAPMSAPQPDLLHAPGEVAHQVGRFRVHVTHGPTPEVRVTHTDDPDRLLFDGRVPGGFLQAGTARTVVRENTTPASGFTITDRRLVRYSHQSVDAVEADGDALVLRGRVRSERGAICGYTM